MYETKKIQCCEILYTADPNLLDNLKLIYIYNNIFYEYQRKKKDNAFY